jgi:hypothetical protein
MSHRVRPHPAHVRHTLVSQTLALQEVGSTVQGYNRLAHVSPYETAYPRDTVRHHPISVPYPCDILWHAVHS